MNPLGAKGLGELPIVGAASAITNAIFHATGKPALFDIPGIVEVTVGLIK